MLFSSSPAMDLTDTCTLFSHPPILPMHLSFCWITVWFVTLTIIHKWTNQNCDCFFFVVQLFVFLKLIVFCLLRFALLSKLSQNWKIFSRCAQAHPIFCQFCWLTCVLGTSLYHLSGSFLPLSLCLHPTYSSFGVCCLGSRNRLVTESVGSGARLPGFKSRLTTGYVTLANYFLCAWVSNLKDGQVPQRVVLNIKGANTYQRSVHAVRAQ